MKIENYFLKKSSNGLKEIERKEERRKEIKWTRFLKS
jgi:hypothetical protein